MVIETRLCRVNRNLLLLISLLFSLLTNQTHAALVSCRATLSDMDFGVVDFVNSLMMKTNNGTLTYHCVNHSPVAQHINACFYLGEGPPSTEPLWFTMKNDVGGTMLFRLKNAVTGELWGTTSSQRPLNVTLSLPGNKEINGSLSVKGELFSNQNALLAGKYRSTHSTNNATFVWSESPYAIPGRCMDHTAPLPLDFIISAVIQKSCKLSARDIDFGHVTLFDKRNIDAQGEITVECTKDTPYNIALRSINVKSGQFYLLPTTSKGGESGKIAYSLYQNASRTLLWSDNSNQRLGQGTGGRQVHPVYGRVSGGLATSLHAGKYQDTVVVTLSF